MWYEYWGECLFEVCFRNGTRIYCTHCVYMIISRCRGAVVFAFRSRGHKNVKKVMFDRMLQFEHAEGSYYHNRKGSSEPKLRR